MLKYILPNPSTFCSAISTCKQTVPSHFTGLMIVFKRLSEANNGITRKLYKKFSGTNCFHIIVVKMMLICSELAHTFVRNKYTFSFIGLLCSSRVLHPINFRRRATNLQLCLLLHDIYITQ